MPYIQDKKVIKMRYKKAKQAVINDIKKNVDVVVDFGCRFRIYPKLRKQMKHWAKEILEDVV